MLAEDPERDIVWWLMGLVKCLKKTVFFWEDVYIVVLENMLGEFHKVRNHDKWNHQPPDFLYLQQTSNQHCSGEWGVSRRFQKRFKPEKSTSEACFI